MFPALVTYRKVLGFRMHRGLGFIRGKVLDFSDSGFTWSSP